LANPDGQELVAKLVYARSGPNQTQLERLATVVPALYRPRQQPRFLHVEYAGVDEHEPPDVHRVGFRRSSIITTKPTAGAVIFMPPFRDPFNYNFDPLIPLGVEAVGTAMHQRLVAEGKGGSAQRSGANYSTWWNGGLRTIAYFHNMIGLLTEIIGNPTPIEIPLVAEKQLPTGDWPLPVVPRTWHYHDSIEYEMSNQPRGARLCLAVPRGRCFTESIKWGRTRSGMEVRIIGRSRRIASTRSAKPARQALFGIATGLECRRSARRYASGRTV